MPTKSQILKISKKRYMQGGARKTPDLKLEGCNIFLLNVGTSLGLHSSKFGTHPFTFSSVVHLDVTPIVFGHFLEALLLRKRGFLAHLDGDLCECGSDPIFHSRNIRRPRHVYLRLQKTANEKVTRAEVERARRPGQIGRSARHSSLQSALAATLV